MQWGIKHPGRLPPYKGGSGRRATPHTFSTIDTYPGTNKVIPSGVRLVTCDTHHYKDDLASKLRISPDDPGSEVTKEFTQHLCAEYMDQRMLWQCPKNKPNYYFDCRFMSLITADILQIKYWQREAAAGVDYTSRFGAVCPWCDKRTKVYKTMLWEDDIRIRYHLCGECSVCFEFFGE